MGRRWNKRKNVEISPDEILLDSSNLPEFDRDQFEGRMERPLTKRAFTVAALLFGLLGSILLVRALQLQVVQGAAFAKQAQENQLAEVTLFADRGLIVDREGTKLAWNERGLVEDDHAKRLYVDTPGLVHAVGYVRPPAKDAAGFFYRQNFEGVEGAEEAYNTLLAGQNGRKLAETDARGNVVSEAVMQQPHAGVELRLSLSAKVSQGLYNALAGRAAGAHAQGAAGVVMDVRTGEVLALVSYPEYSQQALVEGNEEALRSYNEARNQPFLNRAVDGLYAPGSIVKPIMAAAALNEGVIDEYKQILSTGALVLPNPYDPDNPSIFKDWRVNGWTDARRAIAVSSDIYFYQVGGGFGDQRGIGIANIDRYLHLFGFGQDAGLQGFSGKTGTIPTPEWKERTFPNDPTWRVGNTYHTAIGQYGVQVTPLQAARAIAAVANGGQLLTPTLLASSTPHATTIDISSHSLLVAREGMRMGVTEGIAGAVNLPFVKVAAKTGTAQVGMRNEFQNSWMVGFWPYDNPHFAYAVVLERAPAGTLIGGSAVMADFFNFLYTNAPEYLE